MKKEEFKDLIRPIVYGHQSGWLLEDYTEMLMEICEKYHNEQLKLSVVSNNEVSVCVHPYAFLRGEEHGNAECLKCGKKLE